MDALIQQKVQVMIELATKKLQGDINALQTELQTVKNDLANVHSQVKKGMHAEIAREASYSQQQFQPQQQQVVKNTYYNTEDRPPLDKPIDRNGVAPADVSIEKFFYFGGKRK
ncbi:hypothetical protein C4573_06200 [Candidatus Woesearchaeota archaeon]|nr:MAG: hypothetical protein C4573_06200 [Candidatus Woesearchaeota archaeon]